MLECEDLYQSARTLDLVCRDLADYLNKKPNPPGMALFSALDLLADYDWVSMTLKDTTGRTAREYIAHPMAVER